MKKIIFGAIVSFFPFFVFSQGISFDELINIQKMPIPKLKTFSKIISSKLNLIEKLEETNDDLGRMVWKQSNDAKVTLFYGDGISNRIIFQSDDDNDLFMMREKIYKYGMLELSNESDHGIDIQTFTGTNYVVILTRTIYDFINPRHTFEIYKKEDYFKNKDEILSSQKFHIGDRYLDGIVFSLSETGRHGSVMTPFNVANNATWEEAFGYLADFRKENSQYDDKGLYWFVGRVEIMYKIYLNLSETKLVNFKDEFFWTTSRENGFAIVINLKTGERKRISLEDYDARFSMILLRNF